MSTIRKEIRISPSMAMSLNQVMHLIAERYGPSSKGPASAAVLTLLAGFQHLGIDPKVETFGELYQRILKELPDSKALTEDQKQSINQNQNVMNTYMERFRDTVSFFVTLLSFLPDDQIISLLNKTVEASVNIADCDLERGPMGYNDPLGCFWDRYSQTADHTYFIQDSGWKPSEIEALPPEQRRALDIAVRVVGTLLFLIHFPFSGKAKSGTLEPKTMYYKFIPPFKAAHSYIMHESYNRFFKKLFTFFKLY